MATEDEKFLLTQIQLSGCLELTEEYSLQSCIIKGVKSGKVSRLINGSFIYMTCHLQVIDEL